MKVSKIEKLADNIVSITNDIQQWGGMGKRVWFIKYQKQYMASPVEELSSHSLEDAINKLDSLLNNK